MNRVQTNLSKLKACGKLAGGKAKGRRPRSSARVVTALKGRGKLVSSSALTPALSPRRGGNGSSVLTKSSGLIGRTGGILDGKNTAQAKHFAQTKGDLVSYSKLLKKEYQAEIKRRKTMREPAHTK